VIPDTLGSPRKPTAIPEAIRSGLRTVRMGRVLYFYDRISSTNTAAVAMAESGAPDGTVIVAESQTTGRGRMGRSWISPPNVNLYVSIVLRPGTLPARIGIWSIGAAVVVARTIRGTTGLKARLKWPNDILIGKRKVSGLLLESAIQNGGIRYLVLGIGINVNLEVSTLPENLRPLVTSLREELGHKIDRWEILCRLLEGLESEYPLFSEDASDRTLNAYCELSDTLGQTVIVQNPTRTWTGKAIGLTPDGGLILQNEGFGNVIIRSDDVVHLSTAHASRD